MPAEAPWSVFLTNWKWANFDWKRAFFTEKGDDNYHECSGSLITLQWVLTAAHCIRGDKTTFVYAGDVNRGKGQERIAIKEIPHPNFQGGAQRSYDYALIQVNSNFQRSHYFGQYTVNPICLPVRQNERNQEEEVATIYGFGLEEGRAPDSMRRADVVLMPSHLCFQEMICAFYQDQDSRACLGDSGGGVVVSVPETDSAVVIGVVHSAHGNDSDYQMCISPKKVPLSNQFAYIPRIIDWILQTIKDNTDPSLYPPERD